MHFFMHYFILHFLKNLIKLHRVAIITKFWTYFDNFYKKKKIILKNTRDVYMNK